MKKNYLLIAILFFAAAAFPQSQPIPFGNHPMHVPVSIPAKHAGLSRNLYQFYIDYDTADAFNWGGNYTRLLWEHNWHHIIGDTVNGYNPLKYCVVAFDSLFDPYNQVSYSNAATQSIAIDSIFSLVGQENNSGTDDTLITSIVALTAAGFPMNSFLWMDTIIISASAPLSNPNWLSAVKLSWAPGFASNIKRFGVRMEYHGDRADTFGILAGFGSFIGPCGTNPSATLAQTSSFFPNTYNYWLGSSLLLPTATGGFIYYDCNGNAAYDAGSDGASYLQNMTIWCYVHISDIPIGIREEVVSGIKLSNSPNPFSDKTTIRYELQKPGNVEIQFSDITGRIIGTMNEGYHAAGNYSAVYDGSPLSKGIYFYTLKTENGSLTNKMIVSK